MSTLYQDIFDVQKINPEGKKFEKVNRLLCKGLTNDVQLLIDINCDIGFKVHEGDKISVAFASSLAMDGSLDDGTYKMYSDEPTLLDQYEYAMHGQIFEFKHTRARRSRCTRPTAGCSCSLPATRSCSTSSSPTRRSTASCAKIRHELKNGKHNYAQF